MRKLLHISLSNSSKNIM